MAALCRIELFGGLRVLRDDEIITRFRTQKAAALLSYLALHLRQNHNREQLIDLFWPEMDLDSGRDNLSTALTTLRRQLEPAGVPAGTVLLADRRNARLDPAAASTDVDEYDQLLRAASGARDPVERAALLQRATELYRGDLLPGCYEDWAVQEQRRWSERHADALQQWAAALEEAGDWEAALPAARRVVQHDPYREQAYQAQMRLHAALGHTAAALQIHQQLERFLEAELGVSPAQATRELAEELRRDPGAVTARLGARRQPPPDAGAAAGGTGTPRPLGEPAAPPHAAVQAEAALPAQFTRFFGRGAEIARLRELLLPSEPRADPPSRTRLVTLTGPGGAGKTRLAIETALQIAPAFGGRVWFVELAALPDPNLIPFAVAHALKLPSHPSADLLQSAVEALGDAPCLLVLDNFEHLLRDAHAGVKGDASTAAGGGPAIVRLLLERVPRLTCLVTSRQALQLSGEQEFPLPPLGIPLGTDTPERLLEYGSVALYADRARLAKPDFALTVQNAAAVSTLCRRLEGMPLAIEMAAAWAKMLPPTRMLDRLERQLDLLVSRQRDLPPRHQSLRATIEWSYDLLPPVLQQFFARLSVFRGGWTLEAAEAVCGADALTLLAQLQDRSLIVVEEPDGPRYRILEPLREYAVEKLEAHGETGLARARHAACFLALAEQAEPELSARNKKQWLDRLEVEFDNLRAALAWYDAEEGGALMGLRLAGALRLFWALRGRQAEGREWLERALSRAPARTEARAKALDAAGNIARELGELAAAEARFAESLAIMQELGDRQGIANSLNNLGLVAIDRKEYPAARSLHEQSMAIMREIGDPRGIAHSLFNLGVLARQQGDPQAARAYWAECRAVDEALGVKGGVLNWVLGELAKEQGNYAEAGQHWRTGLIECQEIGFKGGVRKAIEYLASLALLEGQPRRSARLWGAATAIHEASGTSFPPDVQAAFEKDAGQIRAALGEESFRAAAAEGRALTLEEALDYALACAE